MTIDHPIDQRIDQPRNPVNDVRPFGVGNPGLQVVSCVAVTCCRCDASYGDSIDGPEDDGPHHFSGIGAAVDAITDAGWWVTLRDVQCPDCADTTVCAEFGHAWQDWQPCWCGGNLPGHTEPMEFRGCASCGKAEERTVVISAAVSAEGVES